ncbi:MAG: response regulator [Anaerolineales bacterium]|nr:response regulator [Anaerolineales bacterium]
MAAHRILIVDDQREVARVFRSGLESLQADFDISDVLSGEEALLELSRGPVDLLVSDVRLPGITGLELMGKFKVLNPELKVVLISGVTDPKIRREVAQAGADAFFFKPVELADFLDAVERILGLVETILPHELEIAQEEILESELGTEGLSEHIARLRQELDATATLLLSDTGQTVVSAGNLPEAAVKAQLTEKILPLFSAGLRVSREIGNPTPENLLSFKGNGFDIFFSHVGEAYALLTITNHSDQTDSQTLGEIASKTGQTAKEILKVLSKLGVSLHEPESLKEQAPPEPTIEAEDVSIDPELDGILDTANFKKEEVDAFWESMSEKKVNDQVYGGDSLSYDQAQQLGLTPSEEEK